MVAVTISLSNYTHTSDRYNIYVEGPGGNQSKSGVTSWTFDLADGGSYWAYGEYVGEHNSFPRQGKKFDAGNFPVSVDMNRD